MTGKTEYHREYRKKNKDRINANRRASRKKQPPKTLGEKLVRYKYYKEWSEKNKEQIAEKRRKYYQENKEKFMIYQKKYRKLMSHDR